MCHRACGHCLQRGAFVWLLLWRLGLYDVVLHERRTGLQHVGDVHVVWKWTDDVTNPTPTWNASEDPSFSDWPDIRITSTSTTTYSSGFGSRVSYLTSQTLTTTPNTNKYSVVLCTSSAWLHTTSTTSTTTEPAAGWCKGYLRTQSPKVPAQSGHRGYCKSCYKECFPSDYAAKAAARKQKHQECAVRKETKELLGTLCKPCANR